MSISKSSDDGTMVDNSNCNNSDVETVPTLTAGRDEKEGAHEEARDKNIVGWDS